MNNSKNSTIHNHILIFKSKAVSKWFPAHKVLFSHTSLTLAFLTALSRSLLLEPGRQNTYLNMFMKAMPPALSRSLLSLSSEYSLSNCTWYMEGLAGGVIIKYPAGRVITMLSRLSSGFKVIIWLSLEGYLNGACWSKSAEAEG